MAQIINIFIFIPVIKYKFIDVYIYVYICAYIHVYACVCVYTHICGRRAKVSAKGSPKSWHHGFFILSSNSLRIYIFFQYWVVLWSSSICSFCSLCFGFWVCHICWLLLMAAYFLSYFLMGVCICLNLCPLEFFRTEYLSYNIRNKTELFNFTTSIQDCI